MKLRSFLFSLFVAAVVNAGACTCAMADVDAPQKFMVSVLLQQSGSAVVVKLFHTIGEGATPEEAMSRVLPEVAKTFPGYTVAGSLVTPVDTVAACRQLRMICKTGPSLA